MQENCSGNMVLKSAPKAEPRLVLRGKGGGFYFAGQGNPSRFKKILKSSISEDFFFKARLESADREKFSNLQEGARTVVYAEKKPYLVENAGFGEFRVYAPRKILCGIKVAFRGAFSKPGSAAKMEYNAFRLMAGSPGNSDSWQEKIGNMGPLQLEALEMSGKLPKRPGL
jgi:hypothetical protein